MQNSHQMLAVYDAIHRRERFLVTSHVRPDGDAIGSMLALAEVLRQRGKHVALVSRDEVPLLYRNLPGANRIQTATCVDGNYDAVILLECDGIPRSGLDGLSGQYLINIDHHSSGRAFADVNWIDPKACAVAEMVYRLATFAAVNLTPAIATCLYTGVITDTGSFRFESTNAHTFDIARELVEAGADPAAIARSIYFANPLSKMALLGAALANLHCEPHLAWLWVTADDMRRTGAREEDCEGIANYAISIRDIEVAIFFREVSRSEVRLSIRGKGMLDVARFAERFGGGGHRNASGCTLSIPLTPATHQVLNLIRQQMSHFSIASHPALEVGPL